MSAVTLFNRYAEHIMRNAGLDELQTGIKIGRSKINPRYVDDTTLKAESKKELKSLLMKVKEESQKVGLKLTFRKLKFIATVPITSRQIYFIWGGSKIAADGDYSYETKRRLLIRRKAMTNLEY